MIATDASNLYKPLNRYLRWEQWWDKKNLTIINATEIDSNLRLQFEWVNGKKAEKMYAIGLTLIEKRLRNLIELWVCKEKFHSALHCVHFALSVHLKFIRTIPWMRRQTRVRSISILQASVYTFFLNFQSIQSFAPVYMRFWASYTVIQSHVKIKDDV